MPTALPPAVKRLFEGKNFAHIATLMKDGAPQNSVVWVDLDGDRILVNTATGRSKSRNVRRDARVALSIAEQSNPYLSATVRGRVVEIREEGGDAHIDKLAKKYMGVDVYPMHRADQTRLILVIEPEAVTVMGA